MDGINTLITEHRELANPFQHVKTHQEGAIYEPEIGPPPLDTKSVSSLVFDIPALRNVRNNFSLFISYPAVKMRAGTMFVLTTTTYHLAFDWYLITTN
jgi:hypothetical protein